MTFYSDMQSVASELLEEFKQGTVYYVAPGSKTGDAWNTTEAAGTETLISCVVSGARPQYVDGTTIHASDLQTIFNADTVTPTMSGRVKIDGTYHQIIRIDPLPAAGTVCAYRVFVRA